MTLKTIFLSVLIAGSVLFQTAASGPKSSFAVGDGTFLLDGEPFVIKAAELHYPRIPRPYWDHRIKMAKALGVNTICLYVFWNVHEPSPGEFDFSGQNDLRAFVELCRDNGLKVILRPGPYVCAEWEMGGLPWWLLQQKDVRLRERDPRFLDRVRIFEHKVAEQIGDLTEADGGPIMMVQVENEYGSYGKDKPYVAEIRDLLREEYGPDIVMFQCDWSSNFLDNGLDDLLWTMNFGTGADIDGEFGKLKEVRPESPLMCSEFWSGWFDKWGAAHETRAAEDMIAGIDEMLSKGISFSLYMTHGGTNFGHWAGANSPGYAPSVTSYDYDAPIDEQGKPTEKYHLLREAMARYSAGRLLPPIPDTIPVGKIDRFNLTDVAPLFASLPEHPVMSDSILTMEAIGQGFGSLLYRAQLPASPEGAELVVSEPHDFALIYVGGRLVGTLDRRLGETTLRMPETKEGEILDILVEGMGRINFGRGINDFKGITERVSLGGEEIRGWRIFPLPDSEEFYSSGSRYPLEVFSPDSDGRYPAGIYTGTFNVDSPADTFLDFSTWGKGLVYVNGHGLGRIWEIGPQQTLYMPGCWLREGENEIMVFDILGPHSPQVEGLDHPINDSLNLPALSDSE